MVSGDRTLTPRSSLLVSAVCTFGADMDMDMDMSYHIIMSVSVYISWAGRRPGRHSSCNLATGILLLLLPSIQS